MEYFRVEKRFFCFLALSLESVNRAYVTLEEDGEVEQDYGTIYMNQTSKVIKNL